MKPDDGCAEEDEVSNKAPNNPNLCHQWNKCTILFLTSLISAIKNGENLDDLIDSVASKGGTTEAGLNLLREKGFTKIFSDGVNKGIQRAKELS